ncbi:Thymidylate synthase ThyX [archaeon HR01]|nr:Thymidylate synthase ThyX [archaeon HR01]
MFRVKFYGYGPRASIAVDGKNVDVGPDEFLAAEGLGTFGGLDVEAKIGALLSSGKDLRKTTLRMHSESTRRGHASITTSLHLELEVLKCSRALSLVLVAPIFGSYLQESQRRSRVTLDDAVEPLDLGDGRQLYWKMFQKLLKTYDQLLEAGVELEDARYLLPLGTATSLFISSSFENYVGLLQLCSEKSGYLPAEVHAFAEVYGGKIAEIAPQLYRARMSFRNRLTSYPYPLLFKPHDILLEKIVRNAGMPQEPVILNHVNLIGDLPPFSEDLKEVLDSVNPLISATTLEPMSLVAYHQAVRHRTVPTAVESIYTAAERALKSPQENIVTPPTIKKDERLKTHYIDAVLDALNTYEELVSMGVKPSAACYILPQALRLYVVRCYNGYNLLYPQGFIGTRTCSYTQWEERGIAYKIWRELEKTYPDTARHMGEKCRYLGYCPEKDWCPIILKYHRYSDEIHKLQQGNL